MYAYRPIRLKAIRPSDVWYSWTLVSALQPERQHAKPNQRVAEKDRGAKDDKYKEHVHFLTGVRTSESDGKICEESQFKYATEKCKNLQVVRIIERNMPLPKHSIAFFLVGVLGVPQAPREFPRPPLVLRELRLLTHALCCRFLALSLMRMASCAVSGSTPSYDCRVYAAGGGAGLSCCGLGSTAGR